MPLPEQRVVFVEDDDALRAATEQALELAGFMVAAFADAETALPTISPAFDGMIVSDIRMPRIDGLALLARVKALDPEIPVVLVTGHGDVPMADAALHDGASDFLTKPFSTGRLALAVRRALDRRALVLDNRRSPRRSRKALCAAPAQQCSGCARRFVSSPRRISMCWSKAGPGPARNWSR